MIVEDSYWVIYFEVLNLITSCIDEGFNQLGYKTYANVVALLLKVVTRESYEEKRQFVISFMVQISRIFRWNKK